ncbi:hypothetical protein PTTG_29696 [Puccinia triticina 1-1 BBBD Race 1]|uniref:Uncharacterized protein n=1 Tax=Puccinia triticina (isolate 1-1 / race 1 (BBBD)) TaxID=630390 RepID=A0A180G2C5_PUCT1|nr:hypothetical protein PTTG_29696 [Puccinia triticina 1-1 BBBD Race 1]
MKTLTHSHFTGHTPPTNTRKVNSIYSTVLPKSTSPLCRSIAAFTRTLLDLNTKSSEAWRICPSPQDYQTGCSLPHSILIHPISHIPESASSLKSEKIPEVFRVLYLQDVAASGFPGATFAWQYPWDSPWNQSIAQFILKHWRHAHQYGVFKRFYIDPSEASNQELHMGTLHRWFLGRAEGLRLGRFSPIRQNNKKQSELKSKLRSQLQKHRQQTLSNLDISTETKELFDDIKCTSETERLQDKSLIKVPLSWRSSEFNSLAQQLDKIHIHKKTNTKGPKYVHSYTIKNRRSVPMLSTPPKFSDVPINLPINCYSPKYINTLSETPKLLLNPRPPIDFSKLFEITHKLYNLLINN